MAYREVGIPSPLKLWATIDGHVVRTARPIGNGKDSNVDQEQIYSGHKKAHGIAYQAVVAPDGLVTYLRDPVPARRHNIYAFRSSSLQNELEILWNGYNEHSVYYIFGDAAYPSRCGMMRNFERHENLLPHQHTLQRTLNVVRTSVEWEFAEIDNLFPLFKDPAKLKLKLSPIHIYITLPQLYCTTCVFAYVVVVLHKVTLAVTLQM